MKKLTVLLGSALLATSLAAHSDTFYKWVDENGVTHYGTTPPTGQEADTVTTRADASSDQGRAIERRQDRLAGDQKAREKAAKAAAEAQREQDEPEEVTKERCEAHRKNLETLMLKPTVRRENPDTGEMEVLDKEARDEMIESTKQALEMCEDG